MPFGVCSDLYRLHLVRKVLDLSLLILHHHGCVIPTTARQYHRCVNQPSTLLINLLIAIDQIGPMSASRFGMQSYILLSSKVTDIRQRSQWPHLVDLLCQNRPMDKTRIRRITLPPIARHGPGFELRPTMLRRSQSISRSRRLSDQHLPP